MLKNELVHHRQYTTRNQAMREITEYIEIFYNAKGASSDWATFRLLLTQQKYFKELNAA